MKQSQLFTKTRRDDPKDEVSKNAILLLRAGYIHKELAGVYDFLPLGFMVLENIKHIIRDEMNQLGAQEVYMSALQDPAVWQATDRWDNEAVDVWFKTALQNGSELGLGFTHEEPLTNLMRDNISSYKDLPCAVYQFQTKFRNEVRAKSGLMRGREFLMKDLYSFSASDEDHSAFYNRASLAYQNIFKRLGIGDRTFITYASGGSFSKYSQEFQTISEAGEDVIYVDDEKKVAINKEIYSPEIVAELGLDEKNIRQEKAVEVGNIFNLGTKFSEPLGLKYLDEAGKSIPVVMGSYGMGPSRLIGVIAETFSDDSGLVWPKQIAPFQVHLLSLGKADNTPVKNTADEIYDLLSSSGVSVLYDDRDLSVGEKFSDADLLGMPWRLVVSDKTLAENKFEIKNRATGEVTFVEKGELVEFFSQ